MARRTVPHVACSSDDAGLGRAVMGMWLWGAGGEPQLGAWGITRRPRGMDGLAHSWVFGVLLMVRNPGIWESVLSELKSLSDGALLDLVNLRSSRCRRASHPVVGSRMCRASDIL